MGTNEGGEVVTLVIVLILEEDVELSLDEVRREEVAMLISA